MASERAFKNDVTNSRWRSSSTHEFIPFNLFISSSFSYSPSPPALHFSPSFKKKKIKTRTNTSWWFFPFHCFISPSQFFPSSSFLAEFFHAYFSPYFFFPLLYFYFIISHSPSPLGIKWRGKINFPRVRLLSIRRRNDQFNVNTFY